MRISLIIPTLNAGEMLDELIEKMLAQSCPPDEIVIVDSESGDAAPQRAEKYPQVKVIPIRRTEFDHGGTRDMALRSCTGDIVLFMTQDAIPVAAVGGRQIARPDATRQEQLVRAHNYPQTSRVWDAGEIGEMGVRAFMISDCCAAYKRDAYLAVGGFDHPIMTNEDMLMAQKLLEAGYAIAYCGDAAVIHSHNMTLKQQFRRNYIVGKTMKRYEERFCHVQEMGEGTKLAKAVLFALLREGRLVSGAVFCLDCAARLLGNRLGRWAQAREEKN